MCVLERGREVHPGEFPDGLLEAVRNAQLDHPWGHLGNKAALYNLHARGDIGVVVGCGLGGTSLINANVSLRADPRVFQRSCWPAELRADLSRLDECFARAETMLQPQTANRPDRNNLKISVLQRSAEALGARVDPVPINVTFAGGTNAAGVHQPGCDFCGNCVSGCNVGSKNTVLMNYLPDAAAHGAKVFTEVSVHHLSRTDGRWVVHCELLTAGRELFGSPTLAITADVVVLAAGALGSTEILLRSRKDVPLPATVGTRFSGNGDVLAFSYNGDQPVDAMGSQRSRRHGAVHSGGPSVTGVIDLRGRDLDEGLVIEDGTIPGGLASHLSAVFAVASALAGTNAPSGMRDALRKCARVVQSFTRGPGVGALRNTLTYLAMAHDDSDGQLVLDEADLLSVSWPAVGDKPIFTSISDTLAAATKPHGATYLKNPLSTPKLGNRLITAHPLGGCPMGSDAACGVVNHKGQVFNGPTGKDVYKSLYIADGSVVPCSLGVNPLLTISALAERTVGMLAGDRKWSVDYDSPTPPLRPHKPHALGIQFTERMTGWAASSDDIPHNHQAAARAGEAANTPISFVFTIVADELDAFLRDPTRPARMIGTVTAPALSSEPMQSDYGTFRLFVPDQDRVGAVHMLYQAHFTATSGRTFFLNGHKDIGDDGLLDLWRDTTTLLIDVYEGVDDTGALAARGILTIKPKDFVRQLRSMRAVGADRVSERLRVKAHFGAAFGSQLLRTYGGAVAPPRLIDSGSPARTKRALRAPEPTLHPFTTDDGVELLLTRYRGGDKGPVLVTHGLGVSSSIFTIDTIDTNLVEYLCAHGYDVWLLELRVSTALPAAKSQSTADDIAQHDYPCAVEVIRSVTGAPSVQVFAHCFGATTFVSAMLAGLTDVRAAVCSQVATHMVVPGLTSLKARLRIPNLLDVVGLDTMSAGAYSNEAFPERLFDRALGFSPVRRDERCDSAVCHRISFLYGLLYQHNQLNLATHDALGEMFGVANIAAFKHLAAMVRKGVLLAADGSDRYMPSLDRLAMPLTMIHGTHNACFLPEGSEKTLTALSEANGRSWYTRHLIRNYGHIDCIFGKRASVDVYPKILSGLASTAEI